MIIADMLNRQDLYPAGNTLNVSATPRMIQTLRKCYELELAFPGKPYGPKDLKASFIGLYERGLLDIDMSNKKLKTGKWYITTKGLQYLVYISAKQPGVNDSMLKNNMDKLKQNLELIQTSLYNLKLTSGRIIRNDIMNQYGT